jgi:hypothetical protein
MQKAVAQLLLPSDDALHSLLHVKLVLPTDLARAGAQLR